MNVLFVQAKTKNLKADIKKELRVFFPKTVFKISSCQRNEENTVITVAYADGPSGARVRNITRQFAHTYYSDRKPVKVSIEVERTMTGKTQNLLLTEMKTVWKVKGDLPMDEHFQPVGGTAGDYVRKIFSMRDF